ncbi:MAG: hypothetical protein CMN75_07565 [Spirochaeta sp.]|nr:hypothetical protein [Spirochaeta sp.]RPG07835.1 MAG: hypothetical protein CBC32_008815 [Proteobacteria bacterium TMED72]
MNSENQNGPWTLAELQAFAESRGGSCLSSEAGIESTSHRFRCAEAHEFEAQAFVLIRGGFWCPHCQPSIDGPGPWDWNALAKKDPTLARFEPAPNKTGTP